jgi:fatty-acyl-CoA synthase
LQLFDWPNSCVLPMCPALCVQGNTALINCRDKVGAIGHLPPLPGVRYPIRVLRYDVERDAVYRDVDGRCVECAPGEAGELVGKIDGADPLRDFGGYTNARATDAKILRDVFVPGDAWFRSGDLVSRDFQGYFFFVDRIGDTFRWKGENVSTAEVARIISGFHQSNHCLSGSVPLFHDVNVYGVRVPGYDGRAGIAALAVGVESEQQWTPEVLSALYAYLDAHMPRYMQPLFLRLQAQLRTTDTFKLRKRELVEEGFDPTRITDTIYLRMDERKTFERLTKQIHQRLIDGQIRV